MITTELVKPAHRGLFAIGALLGLACAAIAGFTGIGLGAAVVSALLGAAALRLTHVALTGARAAPGQSLIDAIVLAALVAAHDDAIPIWQVPDQWVQLLRLSAAGAAVACAMYVASSIAVQARARRHFALRESVCVLLAPVLFNLLLSLASAKLMNQLGGWASFGLLEPGLAAATFGRMLVLIAFAEALTATFGVMITGRPSRDPRLHGLLIATAVHAALTPLIADLPLGVAPAGAFVQQVVAVAAAALAQAGLWAIVYLHTGVAIDAMGGTPPTFAVSLYHFKAGFPRGLIYGGVFIFLVLAGADFLRAPVLVEAARMSLPLFAGIGGALLFPLAQTIIASADGTPPFFGRLAASYREPRSYVRGVVVGLGCLFALDSQLRHAYDLIRFGALFLIGALAYGGVDLVCDLRAALVAPEGRWRRHIQGWRVYALGAVLGGLVGGALGWYFDAAQIDVVTAKFWAYADLSYPAAGRPAGDLTIYPWFNKWGTLDLGTYNSGVKLFYDESLSGMINWSIAAPLFGINFFFLAALFQRSLTPLRTLLSSEGFEGLVAQAVRVLRWGLWMAPIINTFLRQSADPAWYNQDGAVRTLFATVTNLVMPAGDYRAASLAVFTGLLAYDWLRILIWFDHMGLRVATLVNLSFIGGDRADEAAARFAGHPARTRFIPEGIRRFGTWAPLLIPFYIPRGAEWDTAWTGAEHIRNTSPPVASPVVWLSIGYAIAAVTGLSAAVAISRRLLGRKRSRPGPAVTGLPAVVAEGRVRFELSNGLLRLDLLPDGRGHTHIEGMVRKANPIDFTPIMTDPLQLRGPFFYVRDAASAETWSIGYEPGHRTGPDYSVSQSRPNCFRLRNTVEDLVAEAEVSLAEDDCVEIWRVALTNRSGEARSITLVSFRELVLHEPASYTHDPAFNAMHVETWFVRPLNAILARNRLLHDPRTKRTSREIFFHAAVDGKGARLAGYEDSRTRFIGDGDVRRPQGLAPGRPRSLDDQGLLYTFDPAASLTLSVDLAAGETCEAIFVDGYAHDETAAVELLAKHLRLPQVPASELASLMGRTRLLEPLPRHAAAWPFEFSEAGKELRLTHRTPRPWAHLLANPFGIGAIVSNEGAIHSFAGNERENALTPFCFESVPSSLPGQLIYVVDLETGEADCAGFVPFRRADARYEVRYGLGTAVFRCRRGELELELTYFVLPDGRADLRLLHVVNHAPRAKRFRVVPYFEMALAQSAADSLGRLEVIRDQPSEALLFSNPANDFQRGWAFAATSLTAAATETVRARFIGSAGRDLTNPVMVETGEADGSRLDSGRRVAAFAGVVTVPASGAVDVAVVLGQIETRDQACMAASTLRDPAAARAALKATRAWWAERSDTIHVETNQPAFDRLVNHWLPYQVITSRLWGRCGPDQRGGAFGFRDQLQDVLPLLFFDPNLARRQIVLHAGQQFPEGDVLKWWHNAPDGRTGIGERTRASDPHLWLPYLVVHYLAATDDRSVLDEEVAYLDAPAVPDDAVDLFVAPRASRERASVHDHCLRALDLAVANIGRHGLPLIGTGDWNDSIDFAGAKGKGESVWVGFFLYEILVGFAAICETTAAGRASAYRAAAARLKQALDEVWLGDHYPLAFDDEGEVLDTMSAMTSAWPILSGAVDFERGRQALENGLARLEKADRILLSTPPFTDQSKPYPGRVADYPPGVRENGGQYSHGASWCINAYVRLADMARHRGEGALAARFMARAFTCWRKISPIDKMEGEALAVYGLAPHQQAADIYDGEGHGGRGGWSWYTGSAARMLSAAYRILGLRIVNNQVVVPPDLFEPKGDLIVNAVRIKGNVVASPEWTREAQTAATA